MNHIVSCESVCVAGNLFVQNPKASLAARMQNYDYLLSIAAVKRFQGSYQSTLVAQGAFSAYQTEAVQQIGGWQDVMGEDIVLTYQCSARSFRPLMSLGQSVIQRFPKHSMACTINASGGQSVCWRDYPLFRLGNRGRDIPAILLS